MAQSCWDLRMGERSESELGDSTQELLLKTEGVEELAVGVLGLEGKTWPRSGHRFKKLVSYRCAHMTCFSQRIVSRSAG